MSLNHDFYKKPTAEIKKLIVSSISFSAIGISDFGRTVFLKYLTTLPFADKFVFVDIYDLAPYSRIEFFNLLLTQLRGENKQINSEEGVVALCRKRLEELVKLHQKIVIILNRLDLVHFPFDRNFLDNLRTLWQVDNLKIIFIFGICTPIHAIAKESMRGSDVLFYSNIFYLPLYSRDDLKILAEKFSPPVEDQEVFDKALTLSGGHFQLFQLLLKNKLQKNVLDDDFIKLSLKNILRRLNHKQKKILIDIALGKKITVDDPYLLQTRMVQKEKVGYRLFTPLLQDYLKLYHQSKLSAKEQKLFHLLRQNLAKVVSREEIFNSVWGEGDAGATDWALDALAYRLRKNPFFINFGYNLQSHKKLGFSLEKSRT